jgi:hypothetical protein
MWRNVFFFSVLIFNFKIIPGMYVGSIRDSRDMEQITKNNITHILTIYEDPKQGNVEVTKFFNLYLNKTRIGFPYSLIQYGGT